MKEQIGLEHLHTQMIITNRFLAAQLRSTMSQGELIELLSTTGAGVQQIATVLNIRPNAVSVALHRMKKKTKGSDDAGE
jgi:DNA-binding CsgD family transcriptional regulator